LHILSLLTFSDNFVKSVPNFLTYVERRQTDKDKRYATKNTRAKTFNNPLSTETVYISVT